MLAFTPVSEWAQMGAIFGLMVAAIVALQMPQARRFILRRPRSIIVAGIGALGISLLVLFSAFSSRSVDPKVGGTAAAFLIFVSAFVIALPFMAKRVEKDMAIWNATEAARYTPGAFSPTGEVKAILTGLIAQRGALLRVVGPWFLLFCVLPMTFINVEYWKEFVDRDRRSAIIFLLMLVVVIMIELALVFVAMIQWIRFAATKQEPRLTAFPGKALWGWTWRWLIYGAIYRSLDEIEPWLKVQLPTAALWQLDGLQGLIGLAILVLFSPFALVLPAVALDAPDKGIAASMRGFRLVGRKYYVGTFIILAPYAVVSWMLGALSDIYKEPVAVAANVGAAVILFFGTTIVAMTYLTRVYVHGESVPDGQSGDRFNPL